MSLSNRLFSEALRDMQRAMSVFEQPSFFASPMFGSHHHGGHNINNIMRYPATDLVEKPDLFELHAELPGYDKNNIKIEMPDSQTLVLSGSVEEKHEIRSSPEEETAGAGEATTPAEAATDESQIVQKKESEGQVTQFNKPHYWVNERVSGSFSRSFRFPNPVKTDDIKASFENGILKVTVPKIVQNQPRQIKVE